MEISKLIGDAALQDEGVWVTFVKGVDFKVAYAQRKAARNFFAKELTRARRRHGQNRDLPPDVVNKITVDMILRHVLKDWRGLTQDGEPVPYSADAARQVLEQSAQIRDFVAGEANDIENFGGDLSDDETSGEKLPEPTEESGPVAAIKSRAPVAA
jgi:hypothetical protein